MIFKVDKNFKVVLNPEAVKLVPELAPLTNDELMYVILVEDYCDSPFRKKPMEERRTLALKKVFGDKKVNVESQKMLLARDAYKSLVFDVRRETLDNYKAKLSLYHREMNGATEFKRIKELDQMIQYMEERIQKIEASLESDEIADLQLKGNKELSYIEIWQRRQQEYRKFKQTT